MTVIKIIKTNNHITEIECSGHTGYANAGQDILCAAISSVVQSCALGLLNVVKIKNLQISRNDKIGYYKISIPKEITTEQINNADVLLNTLEISLEDFVKGYPKYIKMEVKINDVY